MSTPHGVKERTSWDSKSSTSDKAQGPAKRKPLKLSQKNKQFVPLMKYEFMGDAFTTEMSTPQKHVKIAFRFSKIIFFNQPKQPRSLDGLSKTQPRSNTPDSFMNSNLNSFLLISDNKFNVKTSHQMNLIPGTYGCELSKKLRSKGLDHLIPTLATANIELEDLKKCSVKANTKFASLQDKDKDAVQEIFNETLQEENEINSLMNDIDRFAGKSYYHRALQLTCFSFKGNENEENLIQMEDIGKFDPEVNAFSFGLGNRMGWNLNDMDQGEGVSKFEQWFKGSN